MFKGFNLEGFNESFIKEQYRKALTDRGRTVIAASEADVRQTLTTIAKDRAELNGAAIQASWFPQVKADVFLSYSRRNRDLVLMLAGWLDFRFGLKAFVDSSIWGHAGKLLHDIDTKYCWQVKDVTFDYNLRNESTSHVHMMLMTALGMMIHRTECLIFVNTPDSIAASEVVEAKTYSPWIFAELTMAGIVEEVEPDRHNRKMAKYAAEGMITEALEWPGILHTIQGLRRLRSITCNHLRSWSNNCKVRGEEALDVFYKFAAK